MHKQPSSQHCFICGVTNPVGLRVQFYDDGERTVTADVLIAPEFNGYPGVAHGGIVASILDEVSGRAPLVRGHDLDNLFVTVKLEVRYRRPTPTGVPLRAIGTLEHDDGARARVRGELRLPDGTLTAECESLLMRAPEEFRARWEEFRGDWRVYE